MKKFLIVVLGLSFAGCSSEKPSPSPATSVSMPHLSPAEVKQKEQQERARLAAQQKTEIARQQKTKLVQAVEQKRLAKEKRKKERTERRVMRVMRRELPTYEKAGMKWRNILVQRGASHADMTKLAQKLHAEDSTSNVHLFDDDSKFQQFMDWDINYPDSSYPYPEEWSDKHVVGMINRMAGDDGIKWQLGDGMGQRIAALE